MKKNILVILSILIIILSGCQKKEEVSTYEQDRVAQYILDNVELVDGSEIKKIEFLSFEKPPTAAQTWRIVVEINNKVVISLNENRIGDELWFGSQKGEVKFSKIKKEKKEKRNVEIIYIKEE